MELQICIISVIGIRVGDLSSHTINRLALSQVVVVVTGQETIAIAPDDALNVAVGRLASKLRALLRSNEPVVHIEKKSFHLVQLPNNSKRQVRYR